MGFELCYGQLYWLLGVVLFRGYCIGFWEVLYVVDNCIAFGKCFVYWCFEGLIC